MAHKRKREDSNRQRSTEAAPGRREFPNIPPSPKTLKAFLKKMSEQQETFMAKVIRRLDRMESDIRELKEAQNKTAPKKIKRAGNNSVSEAVRIMHNAENNMHRYDPQTSVSSPHNQKVTKQLMNDVSMEFPNVDPEVVRASCKTYYETIRKSYRMNQEENLEKKEESKITARMRQRKRRLHKARASVLRTEEEAAIWKTATLDMMSEEEDAILDGSQVWVVRPPARSTELSALCGVLQKRLDTDPNYVVNHHARVVADIIKTETTEEMLTTNSQEN